MTKLRAHGEHASYLFGPADLRHARGLAIAVLSEVESATVGEQLFARRQGLPMTRDPDTDPLLVAGRAKCGTCRRESFPLDAQWVDGRFVLVTYDQNHSPACSSRDACATVLLDVDAVDPHLPHAPRPRLCRGTVLQGRRRGQPCKCPAGRGSAYCAQHDPARDVAR